jgi:hypothetical protein|nr:MAG TPA: hypothetical protein [Herelleviridae sp.]
MKHHLAQTEQGGVFLSIPELNHIPNLNPYRIERLSTLRTMN